MADSLIVFSLAHMHVEFANTVCTRHWLTLGGSNLKKYCLHKALAHPGRALAADTHAYDATFRSLENTDAETLK